MTGWVGVCVCVCVGVLGGGWVGVVFEMHVCMFDGGVIEDGSD